MKGSPIHIDTVKGAEIGELLQSGGLSLRVRRFDLAANLVHGFGDKSRLSEELEAEGFDKVIESSLEESLHERGTRH